jgi:hypothetical protein
MGFIEQLNQVLFDKFPQNCDLNPSGRSSSKGSPLESCWEFLEKGIYINIPASALTNAYSCFLLHD